MDEGSKSSTRSLSFSHSETSSLLFSSRCETSSSSSVLALFSSVNFVSKVFMAYIVSINTINYASIQWAKRMRLRRNLECHEEHNRIIGKKAIQVPLVLCTDKHMSKRSRPCIHHILIVYSGFYK